ncbi:MAG: hypothetical protein KUG77_06130, partial [Nannocystaceae bacterium]|nr:hypothetical protein [Nannocystaceae bacterium]
ALTGCGEPPEEDTHGFVKIQFARAQSEAESPYTGTTQVDIQMTYEACYQNFYSSFPNWGLEGEDGELAFGTLEDGGEGWKDRLCEEDVGGRADCEVVGFAQLLDDSSRLTVTYNITGPLEARVLLFGPLPKSELAECDGGFAPRVRLEVGGTRGLDAADDVVWTVSTVSDSGVAAPGDGGALTINAAG